MKRDSSDFLMHVTFGSFLWCFAILPALADELTNFTAKSKPSPIANVLDPTAQTLRRGIKEFNYSITELCDNKLSKLINRWIAHIK
jgi:hypothetical protein